MKESRFTELINLYIDRQITPAEAAELEAELQSNAKRRRLYHQYCRMHRATKLVYESFRHHGEQAAQHDPADRSAFSRIEARQRRVHARWIYAFSGIAAAACLAFVASRVNGPSVVPAGQGEALVRIPVPASVADAATPEAPEVHRAPVNLVSLRNPLMMDGDYRGMAGALSPADQQRVLAALRSVTDQERIPSLFDDDVFNSSPALIEQNPRTYRGRRGAPSQAPVEFTAFQFQR